MEPHVQLRQVLALTPAVESVQENARRQGEREQQRVARLIRDRVELQGHQVEETPLVEATHNDPDEERAGRDRQRGGERETSPAEDAGPAVPGEDDDEERLGARLDRRA